MKSSPYILQLLALLLLTGCDQKQNQLLTLREEFQKQIDSKDKTMEDLHQKLAEIQAQNTQLQEKLLAATKESVAPEKIADSVTKKAEERVDSALAQINAKLSSLEQAIKASQLASAPAPAPASAPAQVPATRTSPAASPQGQPQNPGQIRVRDATQSDPNRKKYKFEF